MSFHAAQKHFHLAGAAGVGMSAMAELLLSLGAEISGSDRFHDQRQDLPVLRTLAARGMHLVPQDGSGIRCGTAALICSTAIEGDNPEIARARSLNIPIITRGDMLGRLSAGHRCIAVAGTSGKTTVTGMTGWLLAELGADPTVVNGGAVIGWDEGEHVGSIRMGKSGLWVAEADESDRSCLFLHPEWNIITNISRDHFPLPETIELFRQFASQTSERVVCFPETAKLLSNSLAVENTVFRNGKSWSFILNKLEITSPLPGRHNAENALLACALCIATGYDAEAVRKALASFKGIRRRLELVGEARGIRVFDDYAHNPAKIAAAWSTIAEDSSRVLGVWRPHGFGPLRQMKEALVEMFRAELRGNDQLFLLPVYYAGGSAEKDVSSDELAAALKAQGVNASAVPDYQELTRLILQEADAGGSVLVMGARDPMLPVFARDVLKRLNER
ncbi:MAG TPA: Mur ligase family protein [Kiritimatiellia bacterium]|nr:Mur ligase family protein [Kiritimatiellia bacterium]HNS80212.1 Mur ligase family protein [Kiritimatiellia bacterium]